MQLQVEKRGSVQVIAIEGRLDVNTAGTFGERLQAVESLPTVLDMGGLSYLSSAGLRALHVAAKRLPKLVVANFSGFCKEIYEISGFASIVPEYTTVDEAVSALS